MLRAILFAAASALLMAEPPPEVMRLFTTAAEALANGDAPGFLDHFDKGTPNYAALRERIEGLLAAHEVGSTVEVVTDAGDERKRTLELDWLLIINGKDAQSARTETRRKVIRCTVERRGRRWRITAIEPLEFFAY